MGNDYRVVVGALLLDVRLLTPHGERLHFGLRQYTSDPRDS